jgi:hypothetical protein
LGAILGAILGWITRSALRVGHHSYPLARPTE